MSRTFKSGCDPYRRKRFETSQKRRKSTWKTLRKMGIRTIKQYRVLEEEQNVKAQ